MNQSDKNKNFLIVVVVLVVFGVIGNCSGEKTAGTTSSASTGVSQSMALASCQYALKALSIDPASAEVPYVNNFGSANEFYFAWGASTKPVRMKNSFGTILSVGASCIVDGSSGKITSLTLDGKTMLGN